MSELRKTEVLKEGKWQIVRLQDIKKGNIFKMTELGGTPITTKSGQIEMIAINDAHISHHDSDNTDIWAVRVDDD